MQYYILLNTVNYLTVIVVTKNMGLRTRKKYNIFVADKLYKYKVIFS